MNKKIVIFDDDQDILTALESVLDFADWDLVTFASGREALQTISREQPDLILMDVRLDGVDGRDICKTIKEDGALKHIPIILISGDEAVGTHVDNNYGPNDFLSKPFDIGDLIDKVYFQLSP